MPRRMTKDSAELALKVGLPAAYIVGFVITNVHLSVRGVIELDLLRGRYVAAALSFIAVAAIPVVMVPICVISIVRRLRSVTAPPRQKTRRTVANAWRFLSPIAAIPALYIVWLPIVSNVALSAWEQYVPEMMAGLGVHMKTYFWLAALAASGTVGAIAYLRQHRSWEPGSALAAAAVLLSVLAIIVNFAVLVYPYVEPQFGGGATPVAVIRFKNLDRSPVNPVCNSLAPLHMKAAIIDQRGKWLVVGTCRNVEGRRQFVTDTLVVDDIKQVTLSGAMVAIPPFRYQSKAVCTALRDE